MSPSNTALRIPKFLVSYISLYTVMGYAEGSLTLSVVGVLVIRNVDALDFSTRIYTEGLFL